MDIKLKNKFKKIKVLILDVDGVLTNGKINIGDDGQEIKFFDVKDGFAIALFRKAGFKTAILSARYSKSVDVRAKDLKIDKVCQSAYPKINEFYKILEHFNVIADEACFMGDDLPDICVFNKVGLAIAVNNASKEAKKYAHYITKNNGGDGAVREVIQMILQSNGKWNKIIKELE